MFYLYDCNVFGILGVNSCWYMKLFMLKNMIIVGIRNLKKK